MVQYPDGPPQFEPHTETVETIASPASSPGRWRRIAAVATGSAALAGMVAVGVVATSGTSGASPGAVTQESTTTTTTKDRPTQEDREARRGEHLDEVLQPLVDDGTITDAQRDAVVKRLQDAAPDRPGFGDRGPGRFGRGFPGMFGAGLDSAAKALGMSSEDLRTELRSGKTIADVAGEKKVSVDTVVDALVADARAKLAEIDLPDGRTGPTDEQLRDAITKMVNGEWGFGHHGAGGRGPWGHGPGDAPDAPDTTTTTTN